MWLGEKNALSNEHLSLASEQAQVMEPTGQQGVTTVRLNFGKKYDTELRTEFLEKVRYGNTVSYFPYRTPVTHALHFCFQVLHFSFLPMTLPRQLRSPLTLSHSPPVTPHNILSSNIVNKLNCYAIIIVPLFNHNPAYSEFSS